MYTGSANSGGSALGDAVKSDCCCLGGRSILLTKGCSLGNGSGIVPGTSFWDVGFEDDSLRPVNNGASDLCARLVPGGGLGWRNGNSPLEVLELRTCIKSLEC